MAVFDTAHRDLYVACTGDSRAVAGVWEKSPDGKGQWRVEVLSEDQTGRNPNELKRYNFRRRSTSRIQTYPSKKAAIGTSPRRGRLCRTLWPDIRWIRAFASFR